VIAGSDGGAEKKDNTCICYREQALSGNKRIPWNFQGIRVFPVSTREYAYSLKKIREYAFSLNFEVIFGAYSLNLK
jgi:hypothetical protein